MNPNHILEPTNNNYDIAAACVKRGGVIAAPSDTNMVLITNPWMDASLERMHQIKGKKSGTPLTLFFLNPEDWKNYGYCDNSELMESVIVNFWPGPLNIIVKKKENISDCLTNHKDTIAMGCIRNSVWRGFMQVLNMPVAMTSANITGMADGILVDFELAAQQIGNSVDYMLKGRSSESTSSSTILDLTGEPKIVRQGDITLLHILDKM